MVEVEGFEELVKVSVVEVPPRRGRERWRRAFWGRACSVVVSGDVWVGGWVAVVGGVVEVVGVGV